MSAKIGRWEVRGTGTVEVGDAPKRRATACRVRRAFLKQ